MFGLGFLAGAIRAKENRFNEMVAQIYGSLLTLAITSLVLPTASQLLAKPVPGGILNQSRSISVVFIVVYFGLLFFELRTHSSVLVDDYGEYKDSSPPLEAVTAITIVTLSTTLVGLNTYFAANSLDGLLNQTGLTISFVGIVLLPLLTNDLEPIMAGYHGNLDLCLRVTVGKCIQTIVFVVSVIVIIGWGMDVDEMTPSFNGFDVTALLSSAVYIAFHINNGKSNW